jgi:hypothetical protein
MSKNITLTVPAPLGVDATSDPSRMPLTSAQQLINWQNDRVGVIRATARVVNILPAGTLAGLLSSLSGIDGIAYYYRFPSVNTSLGFTPPGFPSQLMFVAGGVLYVSQVTPTGYPPVFAYNFAIIAGSPPGPARLFEIGKRVRHAAFRGEVLFVQDGGIHPVRYFGGSGANAVGVGLVGLPTPNAPDALFNTIAAGTKAGTFQYKCTFVDEQGRESSPSAPTGAFTADGSHMVAVTCGASNLAQLGAPGTLGPVSMNFYVNTDGGEVWYQIATGMRPDRTYYDNLADAVVAAGIQAPLPGENDRPNPASLVAVHKNHVFFNDVFNPNALQISNTGSAAQYAQLYFGAPDGERAIIVGDQGDEITGMVGWGDVLHVSTRRNTYALYGDDTADFDLRPVHKKGCIAPDSVKRCNNVVMWLAEDGVYQGSYHTSPLCDKISKQIETYLRAHTQAELEDAVSEFYLNAYWLTIARRQYIYSFDSLAWSILQL